MGTVLGFLILEQVFGLGLYPGLALASDSVVWVPSLRCAFDQIDTNIDFATADVNFKFRGTFEINEDNKTATVIYASTFQQSLWDETPAEENPLNLATGRDVKMGIYRPQNEQFRKYLGGDGYRLSIDYIALDGRGSDNTPDSVNFYMAQTPYNRVVNEEQPWKSYSEYKVLLAVKYHDQHSPSYIRLECSNQEY